jgi:hypothetical protein
VLGVCQSASAAAVDVVPANVRLINAIKAYASKGSLNYVELNKVIVAAGAKPVRFDFPGAGLKQLTPEQAQAAVEAGAKSSTTVKKAGPVSAAAAQIPDDAFTVAGYWTDIQDQTGRWVTYFGTWDFRNGYFEGGNPRDAVAIETTSDSGVALNNPKCYRLDGDGGWAQDFANGDTSSRLTRRGASRNSSVWTLNDGTGGSQSGGPALVDHGTLYLSYQYTPTERSVGWGDVWHGKTFLEHNLDGCNCQWSYSFSSCGFGVSSSQSDPPQSLQKSTGLIEKYAES